ncbi:hypothetical protein OKW32_000622 [Paraburkholderia youngii]
METDHQPASPLACRGDPKARTTRPTTPSLRPLVRTVIRLAQLGGYLARASDPPPGNTVMWREMRRLTDIQLRYELALKEVGNCKGEVTLTLNQRSVSHGYPVCQAPSLDRQSPGSFRYPNTFSQRQLDRLVVKLLPICRFWNSIHPCPGFSILRNFGYHFFPAGLNLAPLCRWLRTTSRRYPPPIRVNAPARVNSGLDKTCGQGHSRTPI